MLTKFPARHARRRRSVWPVARGVRRFSLMRTTRRCAQEKNIKKIEWRIFGCEVTALSWNGLLNFRGWSQGSARTRMMTDVPWSVNRDRHEVFFAFARSRFGGPRDWEKQIDLRCLFKTSVRRITCVRARYQIEEVFGLMLQSRNRVLLEISFAWLFPERCTTFLTVGHVSAAIMSK